VSSLTVPDFLRTRCHTSSQTTGLSRDSSRHGRCDPAEPWPVGGAHRRSLAVSFAATIAVSQDGPLPPATNGDHELAVDTICAADAHLDRHVRSVADGRSPLARACPSDNVALIGCDAPLLPIPQSKLSRVIHEPIQPGLQALHLGPAEVLVESDRGVLALVVVGAPYSVSDPPPRSRALAKRTRAAPEAARVAKGALTVANGHARWGARPARHSSDATPYDATDTAIATAP
jgi:hypothetical protein